MLAIVLKTDYLKWTLKFLFYICMPSVKSCSTVFKFSTHFSRVNICLIHILLLKAVSLGAPTLCAATTIIADGLSWAPWFSLHVVVRCSTCDYVVPNTWICHIFNFTEKLNVVVVDILTVVNAGLLVFAAQGTDQL